MREKKLFKSIILILAILIILGLLKYFIQNSSAWLTYSKKIDNYASSNTTQIFNDIELSNDNQYIIGLYFNNIKYVNDNHMSFKTDGNYTIEYYANDKLIRKTIYNKNYRQIGFSYSKARDFRLGLDKVNVPQDIQAKNITIKLITHQPFSFLKELYKNGEEVKFYIIKRPKEIVQELQAINENYKKEKEKRPKTYLKIPFIANDHNKTHIPLLEALISKDYEKVKQLIEEDNGLDVNITLGHVKADLIIHRKPTLRTPLLYSAYFNDVKTLKYLIEKGSNLNHKDFQNQNALGYAIQNNSVEAAKLLLDAGAKLSDVDYVITKKSGTTSPLIAAVANNSYEMTKLLLEHGAKHKFPSEKIAHYKYDVYHYLYYIDDYKRILDLLLKYDIQSLGDSKPEEKDLRRVYDGCTKGIYSECGPIDRDFKWEDMDIYVYFESYYLDRKLQEELKKRLEKQNTKEK